MHRDIMKGREALLLSTATLETKKLLMSLDAPLRVEVLFAN